MIHRNDKPERSYLVPNERLERAAAAVHALVSVMPQVLAIKHQPVSNEVRQLGASTQSHQTVTTFQFSRNGIEMTLQINNLAAVIAGLEDPDAAEIMRNANGVLGNLTQSP